MNKMPYLKIYFSGIILFLSSIIFNYFLTIAIWKVDNILSLIDNFFIGFIFVFILLILYLMVKAKKELYYLTLFRFTVFIFVTSNLVMGCGGVWFYLFNKDWALLINAVLFIVFVGVLILKTINTKRFHHDDFIKYMIKVDFSNLSINKEKTILDNIIELTKNINVDKKYNFFSGLLLSVGSIAPFLVMGIAFSLEKVGSKTYAYLFLDVVFYFFVIIVVFTNSMSNYLASNLFLFNYFSSNKENIYIK